MPLKVVQLCITFGKEKKRPVYNTVKIKSIQLLICGKINLNYLAKKQLIRCKKEGALI